MTKRKKQSPAAGDAEVRELVRDYKDIRQDYTFDASMFSQEPRRLACLKWIIANKLSEVDRTLILLYTDCQSYRKLGARLGLSRSTVMNEIHRIRDYIRAEYDKIKDNEHIL